MDLISSIYKFGLANSISGYMRSKTISMDLHVSGRKIIQLKHQSGKPSYAFCPHFDRSSNKKSGVAVDNPNYILGVVADNTGISECEGYFETTIKALQDLAATNSAAGKAALQVIAALTNPASKKVALDALATFPVKDRNSNIRIVVDEKPLAEYEGFLEWLRNDIRQSIAVNSIESICSITGKLDLIPTISPNLKGSLKEKVKLISAKHSAYECFWQKGAASSGIGAEAMFLSLSALEYLLSQSGLTLNMGNDYHLIFSPGRSDEVLSAIVSSLDGRFGYDDVAAMANAQNWMRVLKGAIDPAKAQYTVKRMGGGELVEEVSTKIPICYLVLKALRGQAGVKRFETFNRDNVVQNVLGWLEEQASSSIFYMRDSKIIGVPAMVDMLWPHKGDKAAPKRANLFNELMAIAMKNHPPSGRLVGMAVHLVSSKLKSETTRKKLTPEMVVMMTMLLRRSQQTKHSLKRHGNGSDYETHLLERGIVPARRKEESMAYAIPKSLDKTHDDIFYQVGRAVRLFERLHGKIHPNVQRGIGPQMIKMLERNFAIGYNRFLERCMTAFQTVDSNQKFGKFKWLKDETADAIKGKAPDGGLPRCLSFEQQGILMTGYMHEYSRKYEPKIEAPAIGAEATEATEALAAIK